MGIKNLKWALKHWQTYLYAFVLLASIIVLDVKVNTSSWMEACYIIEVLIWSSLWYTTWILYEKQVARYILHFIEDAEKDLELVSAKVFIRCVLHVIDYPGYNPETWEEIDLKSTIKFLHKQTHPNAPELTDYQLDKIIDEQFEKAAV